MNTALAPAVAAGPLYVVSIAAVIVSLLFTGIYRLMVDKRKSSFILTELKAMKGKMKKARERRDEKELKALMGNMLKLQNQQMLLSMKPMLVSLVFVAVIFSWLSYMYADVTVPIADGKGVFKYREFGQNFTASNSGGAATVAFAGGASANAGGTITLAGKNWGVSYVDDVRGFFAKMGGGQKAPGIKFQNLGSRFKVPYSEKTMGWIWLYILVSFPVTIVSRKVLGLD